MNLDKDPGPIDFTSCINEIDSINYDLIDFPIDNEESKVQLLHSKILDDLLICQLGFQNMREGLPFYRNGKRLITDLTVLNVPFDSTNIGKQEEILDSIQYVIGSIFKKAEIFHVLMEMDPELFPKDIDSLGGVFLEILDTAHLAYKKRIKNITEPDNLEELEALNASLRNSFLEEIKIGDVELGELMQIIEAASHLSAQSMNLFDRRVYNGQQPLFSPSEKSLRNLYFKIFEANEDRLYFDLTKYSTFQLMQASAIYMILRRSGDHTVELTPELHHHKIAEMGNFEVDGVLDVRIMQKFLGTEAQLPQFKYVFDKPTDSAATENEGEQTVIKPSLGKTQKTSTERPRDIDNGDE